MDSMFPLGFLLRALRVVRYIVEEPEFVISGRQFSVYSKTYDGGAVSFQLISPTPIRGPPPVAAVRGLNLQNITRFLKGRASDRDKTTVSIEVIREMNAIVFKADDDSIDDSILTLTYVDMLSGFHVERHQVEDIYYDATVTLSHCEFVRAVSAFSGFPGNVLGRRCRDKSAGAASFDTVKMSASTEGIKFGLQRYSLFYPAASLTLIFLSKHSWRSCSHRME
ncbi:OLC1v1016664C1 [Oldenlandia corymbosa var. corymbosa]|uniref:OLC1v1016664C1 n=1 Tax=Oldenlandia corymbosa var. corymbosa TaxID=529605 RepID=A0AAV1E7P0_OLDCO|nr:OLC1v1016664C1 [Oldenlandia corymbosa var. corymbosa]